MRFGLSVRFGSMIVGPRFSILSRGALQWASFTSVKMLIDAIEVFTARWNEHAIPFEWTKEEVHQQQMKYSYSNLRN